MGTETFIFEGPFYCPSQREGGSHLRKVKVVLNKITVQGENQERYCLNIRGRKFRNQNFVFSASEVCFVEKEEVEQKRHHRWSMLDCYRQNTIRNLRPFSALTLIIKQHDRSDSVTLKFLQDSDFSRQSDNGLFKLYKAILGTIGQQLDWFGHSEADRYYGENARLIATPKNVCVLNCDMKILYFYSVENKTAIVSHDCDTKILTIEIKEDNCSSNSVRDHSIRFRLSDDGGNIRHTLQQLWQLSGSCTPRIPESCTSRLSGSYPSKSSRTSPLIKELEPHDDQQFNGGNSLTLTTSGGPLTNRTDGQLAPNQPLKSSSHHSYSDFETGFTGNVSLDVDGTNPKWYSIDDNPPPPPSPPPPPCISNETFVSLPPSTYENTGPIKPLPKGVLRSQSYVNLKDLCLQDLKKDRTTENVYSDSNNYDTYRIYYNNIGWIRPSMSRKIKRRSRLSNEIEDVNFDTVDKHEMWFDQSFKGRITDEKYRRVGKIYSFPQQLSNNIPNDDDQYWNSDLCLTIQYVMENKKPQLTEIFDLSFKQMVGVCVHLSVEKNVRTKDWRDLAEYLGLHTQDIEIIQHFCYKYKEWPTEVVLIHWVFKRRRKHHDIRECSYDALRDILISLEREDILAILQSTPNENEEEEEQDFWEENTRL